MEIMAKKGVKLSKAHRAKLSAAAKKRYAKVKSNPYVDIFKDADAKIGTQLRIKLPTDYQVTTTTNGLISRMTQAIDKIQAQIERLESL
jgi:hypothetical protein